MFFELLDMHDISASLLLFPRAMYVMYLYDTGKMKIDERYKEK